MDNKKVVKNASWIIVAKIVQSLVGVIISMITARYLGPSNFGIINYASSIVAFAIPIMQLGLSSIIVQELINSPNKEGELMGTCIILNISSALLSIFGVLIFVFIFNFGEKETILITFLYSISILFQAFEIIFYWFQAKLLSKYTAVISLLGYLGMSLYKIFLLVTGKSVMWFALSYSLDYLIIYGLLLLNYRRIGGQKLIFNKKTAKRLLSKSKYYIISSLMITIFSQTDRVMLKLMINEEATGYYSAAVSCASMTSFIIFAIIDSMRPVIFTAKKNSQKDFEDSVKNLYSIIIFLSLLQSIFISVLSRIIVFVLYGESYMPASSALSIIVWYTCFSYIGSIRNIWMLGEGKQRYIWIIDLSGAIANVFLNALLIPVLGINGAALASLITQIFANIGMGFILKEIRKNNTLMFESLSIKRLLYVTKKILINFR